MYSNFSHIKSSALRLLALIVIGLTGQGANGQIIDFQDLPLASPGTYYEGADGAGGFTSGGAQFNNSFTDYGDGYTSWEGWAYSNQTTTVATADLNQPDYSYQYSAAAGSGSRGSTTYGVGFTNTFVLPAPIVTLPGGTHPVSLQVTNTTYDAISMLYGDHYAKQFSGPAGEFTGDWFKLTVTGLDSAGNPIGSVDAYLADFRSTNSAQHYVLQTWANVNLSSLASATALSFGLSSSDNGKFGMNTPAYFAADDLSVTKVIGDTTGDGVVNGLDIANIASNWLKPGPVADANGDGVVNGLDIAAVASHWLESQASPAVVPEPGTALLALIGLACAAATLKLRR